jgi:hypothetical protein
MRIAAKMERGESVAGNAGAACASRAKSGGNAMELVDANSNTRLNGQQRIGTTPWDVCPPDSSVLLGTRLGRVVVRWESWAAVAFDDTNQTERHPICRLREVCGI